MQHWICDDTQEAEKKKIFITISCLLPSLNALMLIHTRLQVTYRTEALLGRQKISRVSKQAPSPLMRTDCKEKCNPSHVNLTSGFIFKWRQTASPCLDAALFQSCAPSLHGGCNKLEWSPVIEKRANPEDNFKSACLQTWGRAERGKSNFHAVRTRQRHL